MSRPSLADRLARVAGPQTPTTPAVFAEAAPEPQAQKPQTAQMTRRAPVRAEPPQVIQTPQATPKARDGKTMIAGYFSPEMARSVKILAVERDLTVQALIGEGLDMVLHKYGKHPMGER